MIHLTLHRTWASSHYARPWPVAFITKIHDSHCNIQPRYGHHPDCSAWGVNLAFYPRLECKMTFSCWTEQSYVCVRQQLIGNSQASDTLASFLSKVTFESDFRKKTCTCVMKTFAICLLSKETFTIRTCSILESFFRKFLLKATFERKLSSVSLPSDSQPKSFRLVWGSSAILWVCVHQMYQVNFGNGYWLCWDDSTTNTGTWL